MASKVVFTLHPCHDCSKSQAQHTWACFALHKKQMHTKVISCMFTPASIYLLCDLFLPCFRPPFRLQGQGPQSHSWNTSSFLPHLSYNLPYLHHLQTFLQKLSIFCSCLVPDKSTVCWLSDASVVKIVAIILWFKEASYLNLLSWNKSY